MKNIALLILTFRCLAGNSNQLTFSKILSLEPVTIVSGRITNNFFIPNTTWNNKKITNTMRWLRSGKPGVAKFVRWAETNYYLIASTNQMSLALIATPNFSIPESIVPYQVKQASNVYVIGDVFFGYLTNDIVHVITMDAKTQTNTIVVPSK